MNRIFIIAEAGVNHNGSLETARRLVRAASASGADAVKFQTFISQNVISKYAEKAEYQKDTTGREESQLEMVRKLELSQADFISLGKYCRQCGILFLSTPFDLESIDFLNTMDMPYWKIPSGEITNVPYLIRIARTEKPVILSTGMCTLEEVAFAVTLLEKNGAKEISLLHCNTEYPTPFEDVNLRAMLTLRERFGVRVGYSDHTDGIEVPIAAAALGAQIIEKHFTLDRTMEGPDHRISLSPEDLAQMVRAVRNVEKAMGTGEKRPTLSEQKNIEIVRKSIVAKRTIRKGEIFTEENITVKRPGSGVSPRMWFELLGTAARYDFGEDELIRL